jgi:hypothetical protein
VPSLDTTIGGVSANSYASESVADDYFDERLNVAAWTDADADDRARALISATRWVDTLDFLGTKADTAQALQWPRSGVRDADSRFGSDIPDDEIPVAVTYATCEVALEFLNAGTTDLWRVDATLGVKRKKVDVLETEYFESAQRPVGLERITQAVRLLAPYLGGNGGLSVVRV